MQSNEPTQTSAEPSRNYGVLVVDDEPGVRDLLTLAMRREGFAVWTAPDGREALKIYQLHRRAIDVVLMDVCMPVLDGPHTLVALQELAPDLPCCFMSGNFGAYSEEMLHDLGAVTILKKPFCLDEVANVLLELVSKVIAGSFAATRPPYKVSNSRGS